MKITKQNTINFFKKILTYIKAAKLELIIIAAAIFVDLLSKFLIGKLMYLGQSVTLIPNFLYFTYTKNPFAAFGLFQRLEEKIGATGLRWFFICFVTIATCAFFAFLVHGKKNRRLYRISLALIVGGAIGNLYDRIVHAAVRDFIEFCYFGKTLFGSKTFPIFNLADSCLVIGVILFMVYVIFFYTKDEKAREAVKKAKEAAASIESEQNPQNVENEKINSSDDEATVYAQVGPFFEKNMTDTPPKNSQSKEDN